MSEASRDQWAEERRRGIGASEAAIIFGLSSYKSAYKLWAEKCGLLPEDSEETEIQYWGHRLEPVIADEYTIQTGRAVVDHGRYAVAWSKDCPVMCCTLDREIVAIDDRGPGALEIKTTSGYLTHRWEEEAPLPYQIQVQHQLAVKGWRWGSLAVLIGGQKFRWVDEKRNDRFIETLTRKCEWFWNLVERKEAPPVDGSDSTAETLRRLYGKDIGESIALDHDASVLYDEIEAANDVIKQGDTRKQTAVNKVLAKLGDATFGILPDGRRFSYVANKNGTRVLRRHDR